MQTFIGLVRGINVGPTTTVSMADLRETFEASGYENVETLLQSGNVIFDSPRLLQADAVAEIEREFTARTGIAGRFVLMPEVLALGRNAVYSWSPLGVSKSRVPAAFWRRVAPTVTTRNLNTVTKLAAILQRRVGGPA